VPLRHPAGEAQVDFGEALVVIAGVERKAHYLAMDLPHSDDCFVVAFPAETTEAFLEGHVRAFAYFGGVPTRILYDYVPGNIIITKPPEDALEILEGKFMRFQKSLLRRTRIRPMEGRTLAIERISKTCSLIRSPSRSAYASYQSTCASTPQS